MKRFDKKAVLITGGASGIGFATAVAFLEEGARVAIADISESAGKKALGNIRKLGHKALFVKADVSTEADVRRMVKKVVSEFGRIDVLFNNAGIFVHGKVDEIPLEEWEHILGVNLTGTFLCSKHVIPVMRKKKGGIIINNSSCNAVVADFSDSAYCATKGAIAMLTRSMAVDYAKDNIRVNAILCGEIETPMTRYEATMESKPFRQYCERVASFYPLKRLGTPEEAARVVLFLASDESSFMTGSLVSVDGGLTAGTGI